MPRGKKSTASKAKRGPSREFILKWPSAYPSWNALQKKFQILSSRDYSTPKVTTVQVRNHKQRCLKLEWTEKIEGDREDEIFETQIPGEYKVPWDRMCYNVVYWMYVVKFLHGKVESRQDLKLAYKCASMNFLSHFAARELIQQSMVKLSNDPGRLLAFDEYIIKDRLSMFDARADILHKERSFDLDFCWSDNISYWLGHDDEGYEPKMYPPRDKKGQNNTWLNGEITHFDFNAFMEDTISTDIGPARDGCRLNSPEPGDSSQGLKGQREKKKKKDRLKKTRKVAAQIASGDEDVQGNPLGDESGEEQTSGPSFNGVGNTGGGGGVEGGERGKGGGGGVEGSERDEGGGGERGEGGGGERGEGGGGERGEGGGDESGEGGGDERGEGGGGGGGGGGDVEGSERDGGGGREGSESGEGEGCKGGEHGGAVEATKRKRSDRGESEDEVAAVVTSDGAAQGKGLEDPRLKKQRLEYELLFNSVSTEQGMSGGVHNPVIPSGDVSADGGGPSRNASPLPLGAQDGDQGMPPTPNAERDGQIMD